MRRRLNGWRLRFGVVAACVLVWGCGTDDRDGDAARAGAGRLVGAERTGLRYLSPSEGDTAFARAVVPRAFEFPWDHGAHDEYRSEWWYFTGNLETAAGRHFGFELTFFRFALAAGAAQRASDWGTSQAWMAHFALTDTQAGRFNAAERFARGALGVAGAEASPFKVWVEDWSADASALADAAGRGARRAAGGERGAEPASGVAGEDGRLAARLVARDGGYALDLEVSAAKAPVANGENGLDRKGSGAGNASYYYSISRMDARGTVTTPDGQFAVHGTAWLDREWGTSALEDGAVGWDWFALQLDDGRDLMVYRLRRPDGSSSPFSGGSLIDADGTRRELAVDDVQLEAVDHWTSGASGVRYPVAWRLAIPSEELSLSVRPVLENQELDLTVRYWEGAVRVSGSSRGVPLGGRGYLELAGY